MRKPMKTNFFFFFFFLCFLQKVFNLEANKLKKDDCQIQIVESLHKVSILDSCTCLAFGA